MIPGLDALLGGLAGGIFRMVPEVLKFYDRKNERSHELSMQDASLAADKARYGNQLSVASVQAEQSQFSAAVGVLQEALKGQFQVVGVAWIDGLNMCVRPVLTYSFFALYSGIKIVALANGETLASQWTTEDMGLFSGIMSFYFLGRVFDSPKKGNA